MQPGDKVSWMAVNGRRYGEVARIDGRGIIILLTNGKVVLAAEKSLRKEDDR